MSASADHAEAPAPSGPDAPWSKSRRRALSFALAVLGVSLTYEVLIYLGNIGWYDLAYAKAIVPSLLSGFWVTLELIAVVIPLGFAVGFLMGWARTSRSPILRGVGAVYVDFFRSMPPIVLIAFAFLVPLVSLRHAINDPYLVGRIALDLGVVALALHSAAYQAEIVRAGILSVPTGQTDAADSIGLSRGQTMFRVILPQAFRVSLPALGNEFSGVIKDTSLLSVIGWLELSGIGLVEIYAGLKVYLLAPIVVWLEIAVLYFIVTFCVNFVVRGLEEAFKVPGLEAASP